MEYTQQQIEQIAQGMIDKHAFDGQYSVPTVPFHVHNGQDASSLSLSNFSQLNMSKGAYFTREIDNGNSGTAKTIDWTVGNKQMITTNGNCTLNFNNPLGPANLILRVIHANNATAYTYTYPSSVKWPSGTKPATTNTANAVDILAFYWDGSSYWGSGLLNFS